MAFKYDKLKFFRLKNVKYSDSEKGTLSFRSNSERKIGFFSGHWNYPNKWTVPLIVIFNEKIRILRFFSNSCKHSLLSYLRKSANILCFKALLFTGLSCQEPVSISFLTTIQKVLEHYFNCMIHINKNESFLPYHLNQKDLNPESFWKKTIFKSALQFEYWLWRK